MTTERGRHWDATYRARGHAGVSWHEPTPNMSVALIDALGPTAEAAVIDVGGGVSGLAEILSRRDVALSVLDISSVALATSRQRLGTLGAAVNWIAADVLSWVPDREYDVWHDRAVFHFLTEPADRERYIDTARVALGDDGHLVIATFAPDGPTQCSGLPVARYDADGIAAEFGPAFSIADERREEHVTPSGSVQPFTWTVLAYRSP